MPSQYLTAVDDQGTDYRIGFSGGGSDAAMVVAGAATQLFAASAMVYIQLTAPPAQRGHALSAYNAGFIGFVPAGAFAVAAIAATAGIRWALFGPGLAIVTCAAIVTVSSHSGPFGKSRKPAGPGRCDRATRDRPVTLTVRRSQG